MQIVTEKDYPWMTVRTNEPVCDSMDRGIFFLYQTNAPELDCLQVEHFAEIPSKTAKHGPAGKTRWQIPNSTVH